jgi:selenocysteine lyase/cysteine desulfurase
MMIACQREFFDIPDELAYLNIAFTAPLSKRVAAAGQAALHSKVNPWKLTGDRFFELVEYNRRLFAELVAATPDDVAIVPAVSYGIALAASNLPVESGQSIVVLEDQFASNVYSWNRTAAASGARMLFVPRPADHDWTRAVLEVLDSRTALAALPNVHWSDGTLLDLVHIGRRCRELGAALVVDGTQSVGALPFSVQDVQPDFLVTTAHKWLMGPYSFGFCYVAPRRQAGRPLEENWMNRAGAEDFSRRVDYSEGYRAGARRYDVGEASNFILAPVAGAALEQVREWGVANIAAALKEKTDLIATRAEALGFDAAPAPARSPHMIGISRPGGFVADLPERLAREKVFVSLRGKTIRIAPHLYNTDADLERLFQALASAVQS